ncbi:class I SAM-dependent methyltransferase, partial [Acinetobacter baumannii]
PAARVGRWRPAACNRRQGFNLGWLAPRHASTRFQGIDLTPEHLALAQQRLRAAGNTNVQLQLGDMQQLPQADASIDE